MRDDAPIAPRRILLALLLLAALLPCTRAAFETSAEAIVARNRERYPDEYQRFPPGYDVGALPPRSNAQIRSLWRSRAAEGEELYERPWPHLDSVIRPKLLLCVLSRDEAQNFERNLPLWAPLIDYFVIAIDANNTDDSLAVIQRHLGHLPGEVAEVTFDGMGPTWSLLVEYGIRHFPRATHQIAVDADYFPRLQNFDRSRLDMLCSTHGFIVTNPVAATSRLCNWLFRSVPGAHLIHRVHQLVRVPAVDPSHAAKSRDCRIDFPVEERGGGYGDASGYAQKQLRYIAALELDMRDYPDDPMRLYFLAHAHLDYFDTLRDKESEEAKTHLGQAQHWFERRARSWAGHLEERFFAMIKLAEIAHRIVRNASLSLHWYDEAIALDASRAEPYVGKGEVLLHFRQDQAAAEQLYLRAASLRFPAKDYYVWDSLYRCLSKYLYGELVLGWEGATLAMVKRAVRFMDKAVCDGSDSTTKKPEQAQQLRDELKQKLARMVETDTATGVTPRDPASPKALERKPSGTRPRSPGEPSRTERMEELYDSYPFYRSRNRNLHVGRLVKLEVIERFAEARLSASVPAAVLHAQREARRYWRRVDDARTERELERLISCKQVRSVTASLSSVLVQLKPRAEDADALALIGDAHSLCRSRYFDDDLF